MAAETLHVSFTFDLSHAFLRYAKSTSDIQAPDFVAVVFLFLECGEALDVARPEFAINLGLSLEAPGIPVALDDRIVAEKNSNFGMVGGLPLVVAVGHDVEQGTQWRAGVFYRAVLKVDLGYALLSFDDVLDSIDVGLEVLLLWTEHLFVEE